MLLMATEVTNFVKQNGNNSCFFLFELIMLVIWFKSQFLQKWLIG